MDIPVFVLILFIVLVKNQLQLNLLRTETALRRLPPLILQVKENTGEEKNPQGKIRERLGTMASSRRGDGACQSAG